MAIFITILILAGMIFLAVMLSFLMQSRAVKGLVRVFRQKEAFYAEKAVSAADLGIRKQHMLFRKRDYRPQMLQFLISAGVVHPTEDDRYFLSNEKLAALRGQTTRLGKLLLPE